MVDLELLSPQGDMSKLLGQFATILILFSIMSALGVLDIDMHMTHEAVLRISLREEHSLISLTMLVVGLFAVLSWDSTFPDRRDVMVLAPLPVRTRTIFLAKVAAAGTALSLTVATVNLFPGLLWPLALAPPDESPLRLIFSFDTYHRFAAYWLTMFAAGGFIFCCVLCVQGLAAQLLSRRMFLRASALMQMGAFCLFLCAYFLQLRFWPSHWFVGLGHRGWIAFFAAALGAAGVFVLSYCRTMRKIVEEPDIVPQAGGRNWLPRFSNLLQTAVLQFSIRTLLRSRQHRVILAFYFGFGFAIAILLGETARAREQLNVPLLLGSIVMMSVAVIGTRVVFSMPLTLRANWVFRLAPIRGGAHCLAATRRSLLVLAVAPVWLISAAFFFTIWPWREALAHLIVLGLVGMIAVDAALFGFGKIPFTCSYLPGKSYFHMVFFPFMAMVFLLNEGAAL